MGPANSFSSQMHSTRICHTLLLLVIILASLMKLKSSTKANLINYHCAQLADAINIIILMPTVRIHHQITVDISANKRKLYQDKMKFETQYKENDYVSMLVRAVMSVMHD